MRTHHISVSNLLLNRAADQAGEGTWGRKPISLRLKLGIAVGLSLTVLTNASAQGPPTIIQQPISQTANLAGPVSFTVAATGTPPLSYQWRLDDVNLVGETTAALSIANARLSNSGTYTVVINNSISSITSAPVVLNVVSAPWRVVTIPGVKAGTFFGGVWTPVCGEVLVWAAGDWGSGAESRLYQTKDSGETWRIALTWPSDQGSRDIWGTSAADLYASSGSNIWRSVDGGYRWTLQTLPYYATTIFDFGGSPGAVQVVAYPYPGTPGTWRILRFDGTSWSVYANNGPGEHITVLSPTEGYFSNGDSWGYMDATGWHNAGGQGYKHTYSIWGARDPSGTLFLFEAGSEAGYGPPKIWRFNTVSRQFNEVYSDNPSCRGIAGSIYGSRWDDAWALSANGLGAPCNEGHIYHWDGASWRALATPFDPLPLFKAWPRSIWGTASSDVWVGCNGRLLHYYTDAVPPEFTMGCTADIVHTAEPGLCSTTINYTIPAASDNCDSAKVVCDPPSGGTFAVGMTTVVCTATDTAGNTASCSFTVTIMDDEMPQITCPANMVRPTDPGVCTAVVSFSVPVTDNCPGVSVHCTPASGSVFDKGSTTVNCTATDAVDNTASCSFMVVVEDRDRTTPADIDWVRQIAFGSSFDFVRGVAADGSGVYAVGETGPSFGEDAFVQKRDGAGNVIWSHTFGTSPRGDSAYAVAVDASGLYVAGWVAGALPGQTFVGGNNDAFVRKYDTDGNEIWTREFGTNTPGQTVDFGRDQVSGIALAADAVYLSGSTEGHLVDGAWAGGWDAFVRKYNKDGTLIWTRQFADEGASAIAVDASGVYVLASPGKLQKFDHDGTMLWNRSVSGSAIAADTSGIYVHGSGNFVRKYDADGNQIWHRSYGTTSANGSGGAAIDSEGIYVAGLTRGTYPGQTHFGEWDATVRKYDRDGYDLWTIQFGTAGNEEGPSIATLAGVLYVGGGTTGTFPGQNNIGGYDGFVAKLNHVAGDPPVPHCPAHIVTGTDMSRCDAIVNYSATVTDNCPGATIACVPPSGSTFLLGMTTVLCTATDTAGNTASCSFTVTIMDEELPQLTCPANMVRPTDPGVCTAVVSFSVPATDNCPGLSVNCTPASGSVFDKGSTTVDCIAADAVANTASCSFMVTIVDRDLSAPPTMGWIRQFAYSNARGIGADATGVYLAGETPGDAYVRKYNPEGNVVWSQTFGTGGSDAAYAAAVDESGFYVGGWAAGALPGQTYAGGDNDAFVRRYDLNGNEIWTREFGTNTPGTTLYGRDNVLAIALTGDAIYAAGQTEGHLVPGAWAGDWDGFLRKYDKNGNLLWTRQWGTAQIDSWSALAVDDTGVYLTGLSGGPFNYQAVVHKYSHDGDELWGRQFGDPTKRNLGVGLGVDSTGVYVHGSTEGVLPGQSSLGGQDNFVRKYDPAGNVLWTRQYGTSGVDSPGRATTDTTGLYVSGYTWGAYPGYANQGSADVAVLKYDRDGNQIWSFQFGTTSSDDQPYIAIYSNMAYVAGGTTGAFPGQTYAGGSDSFVTKLGNITGDPPVLLCPADIVTGTDPEACDALVDFIATVSDNCPGTAVVCEPPSGSTFPLGITTVNCVATDAAGLKALCSFKVTVYDATTPAIMSDPASVVAEVGASVSFTVAATACTTLSYQWQLNEQDIAGANAESYSITKVHFLHAGDYRVVLSSAGGRATSAVATLTVNAGSCAALWLKADDGPILSGAGVSQWNDQSGNNRVALQANGPSQPVLVNSAVNGLPVVRFDGMNDFMTFNLPVNGLNGMTIFLVAANRQPQTGGSSQAEAAALFWNETQLWGTVYVSPYQSSVAMRFGTLQVGNRITYSRPSPVGNDFTLSTAVKNGSTDALYVNRVLVLTQNGKLPGITGCRNTGNLARGYNDNTYYNGDIAEVIVYTCTLSAAQREAIEEYLDTKYGLTRPTPPEITRQPADVTVEEPGAATFSVGAQDTLPLSYQWRRGGTPIPGAINPVYVLDPTSRATDNGALFDVVIMNGVDSITSRVATLTVTVPLAQLPSITMQPANLTVVEPNAATFTVAATGASPLKYQWRRGAADIPGATDSSYILSPTSQAMDQGAQFEVVVSNVYGAVTSHVATLTVLGQVPAAGMALWLRADVGPMLNGSAITQWTDQSGHNRHATQSTSANQPLLISSAVNGLPAVRFDGANDFMTFNLPVNGLTGMSIFLVGANRQSQTPGSSGAEHAALFWNETTSWGTVYLSPFQSSMAGRFGTTQVGNRMLYPVTLGANFALCTAIKNGTTDSLYVNRELELSQGGKLPAINGCRDVGNLARGYNDNSYYNGDIAEVLVYTRALSEEERQTIEQYLDGKYHLTSPAPPKIQIQPADLAVIRPNAATFSVAASGEAPLGYQWRREGSEILGATAASYVLSPTSTTDSGAHFDVVVSNAFGSVTSTVATLTVVEGLPSSGLALWLKADLGVVLNGAAVLQWTDQSGNNRHSTQATSARQPMLSMSAVNGLPAVSFDGVDDFLSFELPVNGLNGMSLFLVAANTISQSGGSSQAEQAALFWNETQMWSTLYLSPYQGSVNARFGTTQIGNRMLYARPAPIGSAFSLSAAIKNGTADALFVNGGLVMSQSGKLPTIVGCRDTGNLGRGYNDNTYYAGRIAEVLVYTRALSDIERQAVEQYLTDKYSLPSSVPPITARAALTDPSPGPLSIRQEGETVVICWPLCENCVLEGTLSLEPPFLWVPVEVMVNVVDGQNCVTFHTAESSRFLRLRRR